MQPHQPELVVEEDYREPATFSDTILPVEETTPCSLAKERDHVVSLPNRQCVLFFLNRWLISWHNERDHHQSERPWQEFTPKDRWPRTTHHVCLLLCAPISYSKGNIWAALLHTRLPLTKNWTHHAVPRETMGGRYYQRTVVGGPLDTGWL